MKRVILFAVLLIQQTTIIVSAGQIVEAAKIGDSLIVKTIDEYIGKYYIGDYLMLEIWREGRRLKIMEFGYDEIYPVAKDFFYFKSEVSPIYILSNFME